jgi:NTP pyrophosphatase (non-canonical NTP hydrolase)
MALNRKKIFEEIEKERDRQEKIHQIKNFDDRQYFTVLVEEIGEIAAALQGEGNLKEELIQAAAVCIRFLEKSDHV